jgi:phosphonate transport system substrate-binding protein
VGLAAAPLRCVSLLAANGFEFYRAVVEYLVGATGVPISLAPEAPQSLDGGLARGDVDLAFTCGLPYVRLNAARPGVLRLLGAPVLAGERYSGRPAYFSDFVVRAAASWQTLGDLRGATFAYNEVESLSGYILPLAHLHAAGETSAFFGRWQPTGSHAASLDAVERGQAGVAAIDSVVLAMEGLRRPERRGRLRVVASAGPLAMPPLVAAGHLPRTLTDRLSEALWAMPTTLAGQAALALGGATHFASVADADYDGVRAVWSQVQSLAQPEPAAL